MPPLDPPVKSHDSPVPATSRWLSDKEKAFVQARLPKNSPRAGESHFRFSEIIRAFKDTEVWLFLCLWAFHTIGTTGLSFYQPTVIANLGFSSISMSQLLNIPTAVLASLVIILFGLVSNTACIPQPLIPLLFLVVIEACYAVLYTFPNTGGVDAATMIAGGMSQAWYTMMLPVRKNFHLSISNIRGVISQRLRYRGIKPFNKEETKLIELKWRVQTTEGATGSAFAIAFANSYGQIGGAVGSQLFSSRYAP
ncbi:putative pantothenate transporter [Diplocarpon rosae]|nr:putative pantothenate transporter [Diplocarpon rosae]